MRSLLHRELRSEARRPGNYWLRVVAGASVLICFGIASTTATLSATGGGGGLFRALNIMVALVIWLLGPVLTSDCISRERREGTLPLLFLTPVRAWEIVAAKSAVHWLRGISIVAAAFPLLIIPLLHGGVTFMDIVRMLLLHAAALLLALCAGLVATTVALRWWTVRVTAVALSISGAATFLALYKAAMLAWSWPLRPPAWRTAPHAFQHWWFQLRTSVDRILGGPTAWSRGYWGSHSWDGVGVAALTLGVSLLLVLAGGWLAVLAIRRNWRELEPPRARPSDDRLNADRHRTRRDPANPIALLAWVPARPVAVAAIVTTLALGFGLTAVSGPNAATRGLWWLLWLAAGFAGAAGFRRELESGALELLLVSPLEPAEILRGRWWSIARPFVLVGVCLTLGSFASAALAPTPAPFPGPHASLLLMIPLGLADLAVLATAVLVGMTFALSRLPFPMTVGLTWLIVLILPAVMIGFALSPTGGWPAAFLAFVIGVNLLRAWKLGLRQLARREFAEGASLDEPEFTGVPAGSTP